jgi:hypothetical protein
MRWSDPLKLFDKTHVDQQLGYVPIPQLFGQWLSLHRDYHTALLYKRIRPTCQTLLVRNIFPLW